jgi:hypothetical protein
MFTLIHKSKFVDRLQYPHIFNLADWHLDLKRTLGFKHLRVRVDYLNRIIDPDGPPTTVVNYDHTFEEADFEFFVCNFNYNISTTADADQKHKAEQVLSLQDRCKVIILNTGIVTDGILKLYSPLVAEHPYSDGDTTSPHHTPFFDSREFSTEVGKWNEPDGFHSDERFFGEPDEFDGLIAEITETDPIITADRVVCTVNTNRWGGPFGGPVSFERGNGGSIGGGPIIYDGQWVGFKKLTDEGYGSEQFHFHVSVQFQREPPLYP